jgi:hypothetical protein
MGLKRQGFAGHGMEESQAKSVERLAHDAGIGSTAVNRIAQ